MFDCVLRSLCSALSPTTPSATIINVIVRMSGTAVGVFLAENLSSLTLSKVRDFERVLIVPVGWRSLLPLLMVLWLST